MMKSDFLPSGQEAEHELFTATRRGLGGVRKGQWCHKVFPSLSL
jgi:hypothetical protein